ncbi:MRC1-like domain-containing protein [Halenospora varia]|nr:MRC1-like domain-containing protein [Halenospora varia]
MASSRETSPAVASNPASPEQLTPTSKVRALLANFDDDSDEENTTTSATTNLKAAFTKAISPRPDIPSPEIQNDATNARSPAKVVEEEDDEEDIVRPASRPLGRMAARMLASEREQSADGEDNSEEGDVRARGRKILTQKKAPPPPAYEEGTSQDSEESDVPVVSRKRKLKTAHHETPKSSPMKEVASPGLFVSPTKTINDTNNSSDSDLPEHPHNDDRFKALVKEKREERLAREAEAAAEKAKKLAERKKHAQAMEEDEDDISDEDVDRRLTQPTRKASKKAQEEIRRETQRMSRNQQLTYKPTTKKKVTRANLFAKFNYRQEIKPVVSSSPRRVNSSSPAPQSDVEMKDTPPTSPASPNDIAKDVEAVPTQNDTRESDGEELPVLEEAMSLPISSPPKKLDKGKGKAVEEVVPEIIVKKPTFTQRPIKVRPPKVADRQVSGLDDSDSDLEIVNAKTPDAKRKKLDSIFNRVPAKQAKESHSLHALRMLAHLKSPNQKSKSKYGKTSTKPSMTTGELQMSLQQRARQQAAHEREERLQALRDKGVIVQTSEEREKELVEVEDLLAKARREGEAIMKREKAAAKKARKESGEVDPLGDSSDDEDWQEDKGDKAEQAELSMSGSEDEEEGDASGEEEDEEDEDLENEEPAAANSMFDNEAGESENDEVEADLSVDEKMAKVDDADDEEDIILPVNHKQRRNKKAIISDDEDEEEQTTPVAPHTESPMPQSDRSPGAPNSVLRSATKTFIPGLTVAGPAGLGLTQIFAGTMDESQFDEDGLPSQGNPETQRTGNGPDAMAFLRRLPAPELPPFMPTMEEDTQDQDVIMDSQSAVNNVTETQADDEVSQQIQLQFEQSQMHSFDSLVDENQFSPFPEATQDAGFKHMTPIRGRFADPPPSTVGTVVLGANEMPETMEETPIVKKKGRLHRRAPVVNFSDDEETGQPMETVHEEDDFDISANAFDIMRKASKPEKVKVVDEFDKKNSKAKEMVHEQAEESEDEYAGLGGASDDESGGEADAFVKEMIDDEGGKDVDEGKLAAFFADRERASDEKQIKKLYNDISKGTLRRKRGADYDLSDSDDGGEAKQRRKRAQEAKMRKALLADERIGKIAQNPKREAFLRAIEDRGSEDEMDFLEDFAEQDETTDSQSQDQGDSSQQVIPSSQPAEIGPSKRKRDDASEPDNRPPPHLRRTKTGKKPTNLSEIRESLSSLIEEPNAVQVPVESESEDELEIEGEPNIQKEKENRDPFSLRRTKVPVIDRISLKRQSSSSISASTKMAFAVSSSALGFKVPPLLRRATTNNSLASSTSSSVTGGMSATERMAGGSGSDGVKRGGGKNSGVNYFARETERRAAVVKTEKRREVRRAKGAEVRRKVVGGLFGVGGLNSIFAHGDAWSWGYILV